MWRFLRDILIYVIGGVTFIPLVVAIIFLHGYFTLPQVSETPTPDSDPLHDSADDGQNVQKGSDAATKLRTPQEKEIGGYFAVCREWVPGGVNGKPPERTTPAGEVAAEESPSVYQSMYRSIFDRKQAPTLEVPKAANGKLLKRATNVFYVVLRHGHLMLYDDAEQVEVRYVISLAYHDVTVYGGGDDIPEGELWIKRNAICLSRKAPITDSLEILSKPFYLFSENCSEKEDFYFAILQHQERDTTEAHPPPLVQHFELNHIIKLVQTLHSSEEHLQTRWFNALLGRLFLSVYKTPEIESFIRQKITKKIARAKKPNFLSGIKLQKIDLGESAPFVTNPRLKDLNVDGDCCVEADVRYDGKFRIEIATTAKVDLGARFKAREFDLVLAITVKKLEGHAMLRFKPAPSNRFWYSFEKMPRMELQIEPIVGSRQITYGVLLRAIESRIREVFAETLVVPHWDDSPFHSTLEQHFRGGIWVHERQHFTQTETVVPDETNETNEEDDAISTSPLPKESMDSQDVSIKSPTDTPISRIFQRKPVKSTTMPPTSPDPAASAAATSAFQRPELPRVIRSRSFAQAATPIVSPEIAESDVGQDATVRVKRDAASVMSELSHRPQTVHEDAAIDASHEDVTLEQPHSSESSSRSTPDILSGRKSTNSSREVPLSGRKSSTASSSSNSHPTMLQNVSRTLAPSAKKQQSLGAAALAAKSWGWKTLTKGRGAASPGSPSSPDLSQPMGRGQPILPPSQPLSPANMLKAAVAPALPPRNSKLRAASYDANKHLVQPRSAPPNITVHGDHGNQQGDGVMVVEAPIDSGPPSPAYNEDDTYGEFLDNVPHDETSQVEAQSTEATKTHIDRQEHDVGPAPDTPSEADRNTSGSIDAQTSVHDEKLEDRPACPLPRLPERPAHTETADDTLEAWDAAEEEEARSKSVWIDEPEIS